METVIDKPGNGNLRVSGYRCRSGREGPACAPPTHRAFGAHRFARGLDATARGRLSITGPGRAPDGIRRGVVTETTSRSD